MSFGTPSGPPASAKQVRELLELLQAAGHADFRDARGPMGFTQRQAGGKFTRAEAEAFIAELQEASEASDASETGGAGGAGLGESAAPSAPAVPAFTTRPAARRGPSRDERLARSLPDEVLAAELQRRGWAVLQP